MSLLNIYIKKTHCIKRHSTRDIQQHKELYMKKYSCLCTHTDMGHSCFTVCFSVNSYFYADAWLTERLVSTMVSSAYSKGGEPYLIHRKSPYTKM